MGVGTMGAGREGAPQFCVCVCVCVSVCTYNYTVQLVL